MRNTKGQFKKTTGSTRYKKVQHNGRIMNSTRKIFILKLGLSELPNDLVVHHLDGNTRNDDINNLALLTMTAHNRIHSHSPWNKGLKASTNEKWAKTVEKQRLGRLKNKLPLFKQAFRLQLEGKKLREIAEIQGISRRQVSDRIMGYKNYVKSKS